jgi:hypothetical protein
MTFIVLYPAPDMGYAEIGIAKKQVTIFGSQVFEPELFPGDQQYVVIGIRPVDFQEIFPGIFRNPFCVIMHGQPFCQPRFAG